MKHIQKIIPSAIKAVETKIRKPSGEVDKEFNGYISSFGASIISAGLLPSVIFFSQQGESASERHKIILAIEEILQQPGGILHPHKKLLMEVKDNIGKREHINRLTEKISDAAIALKLAIRTFPKSK